MSTDDRPGPEWRWALPIGRTLALIVLMIATLSASAPEHRAAVIVALAACLGGALYGLRFGPERWAPRLVGLAVLGAGGCVLVAADPSAPGWLASGVSIAAGLVRLPQRPGLILAAATTLGTSLAPLWRGDTDAVAVNAAVCAGCAVLGMVLAGVRSRAVTAERLLASEEAAREAAVAAERYAERQRLAREIHDILAHTLSAQAVQLEGARLLLEHGQPADAVRQRIETAQRLAREGLEETRRAVHSLRGQTRPLPETLRALATTAGASYHQEGVAWALPVQASLAIERTVQEALTNARKHAPNAQVSVTMRFREDHDEVEICDSGGSDASAPVVGGGGGYGLAGMRERAALIGAELTTGPHAVGSDGRGYRVWLTVPRSALSVS